MTSPSTGGAVVKNFVLLGATGSIGTQTLDVARAFPDRLRLRGLSAHTNAAQVFDLAREFNPRWIAITDETLKDQMTDASHPFELLWGESGVERMVTDPEIDTVVAAMVGAAGLRSAARALEAGKDVALANKETLVVGGPLVTDIARRSGARILPVDSEHSAIFQCLRGGKPDELMRIILTASGGPFRLRAKETFDSVTVEEALAHPTWRMGPKITIDSATMMNKALEIIEAHWLFGLSADQIHVVIHPQSMVHSMVEFVDGSVMAQASPPDMRLPIQFALSYPDRWAGPARKMELSTMGAWEFEEPDLERFPAIRLGYEVVRLGGTSGAALNAANEVAVARFLKGEIGFTQIVPMCEDVLKHHPFDGRPTLADLESVDRWARQEATDWDRSSVSSKRRSSSAWSSSSTS